MKIQLIALGCIMLAACGCTTRTVEPLAAKLGRDAATLSGAWTLVNVEGTESMATITVDAITTGQTNAVPVTIVTKEETSRVLAWFDTVGETSVATLFMDMNALVKTRGVSNWEATLLLPVCQNVKLVKTGDTFDVYDIALPKQSGFTVRGEGVAYFQQSRDALLTLLASPETKFHKLGTLRRP